MTIFQTVKGTIWIYSATERWTLLESLFGSNWAVMTSPSVYVMRPLIALMTCLVARHAPTAHAVWDVECEYDDVIRRLHWSNSSCFAEQQSNELGFDCFKISLVNKCVFMGVTVKKHINPERFSGPIYFPRLSTFPLFFLVGRIKASIF